MHEAEPHLPGTMLTNVVSVEEMAQAYKNCSRELKVVEILSLSHDMQLEADQYTMDQLAKRMQLIHQEIGDALLLKDHP